MEDKAVYRPASSCATNDEFRKSVKDSLDIGAQYYLYWGWNEPSIECKYTDSWDLSTGETAHIYFKD